MENCFIASESKCKSINEYEADIDSTIQHMIEGNERLVFAVVAEKAGITRFVIRQYPELRNHILRRMAYFKEIQVINQKIDRAVNSLLKANKSLTFMAIVNKCKFTMDMLYQNSYIKDRIRSLLSLRHVNN